VPLNTKRLNCLRGFPEKAVNSEPWTVRPLTERDGGCRGHTGKQKHKKQLQSKIDSSATTQTFELSESSCSAWERIQLSLLPKIPKSLCRGALPRPRYLLGVVSDGRLTLELGRTADAKADPGVKWEDEIKYAS
jgi:hypothetical protein